MIRLRNITKSFGDLQVLKGIDLYIEKGEIVSIVGPSGAGKTTLLQIMGTLDKPDSGTIEIDGEDISKLKQTALSKFRNKNIGFVFVCQRQCSVNKKDLINFDIRHLIINFASENNRVKSNTLQTNGKVRHYKGSTVSCCR